MQSPFKETFINELRDNAKVSISGFIVDKKENSIVVNDTTESLPVVIETDLELNTFVRVFGQYMNGQLQGYIIQNLNSVNKQLYNKVKLILNQKQ